MITNVTVSDAVLPALLTPWWSSRTYLLSYTGLPHLTFSCSRAHEHASIRDDHENIMIIVRTGSYLFSRQDSILVVVLTSFGELLSTSSSRRKYFLVIHVKDDTPIILDSDLFVDEKEIHHWRSILTVWQILTGKMIRFMTSSKTSSKDHFVLHEIGWALSQYEDERHDGRSFLYAEHVTSVLLTILTFLGYFTGFTPRPRP